MLCVRTLRGMVPDGGRLLRLLRPFGIITCHQERLPVTGVGRPGIVKLCHSPAGRLPRPPHLARALQLRLTATCAPVLPLSSLARLQGWAPASGQPFEAVAVLGAGGAPPLTNDVPGLRWSAGHLAGLARAVRRRRVRDAGAVVVPPMRPVCAGLACGLPPGVGGRVGGSALGCDAHGPI